MTCTECGAELGGRQLKVCSTKCRNARLYKSDAFKRAQAKAGRYKYEQTCVVCGGVWLTARRTAKLCSTECRSEARRRARLPVLHPAPPPMSWLPRKHPARRPAEAPTSRVWVAGPCSECGEPFVFNQPAAEFCSPMCARRHHRRRYRQLHGRMDNHRHRARVLGLDYEPISKRRVFERDNWRCQLCGLMTKRTARVPDPKAPTLEGWTAHLHQRSVRTLRMQLAQGCRRM